MILEYQLQLSQLKIERLKHALMDQYYVSLTMSMFPSHKYTTLHKSMKIYYIIKQRIKIGHYVYFTLGSKIEW